ncbi:MAG TPA: hypothetical protein VE986_02765 [Hyphomicrobiales bacterium]|nr:hypothetical protein [Hyphomicrobiales bacterium]
MIVSNYVRIAVIAAIIAIFLFIAVGPPAGEFRALLHVIFDFVTKVAWPLAAVLIVLILRKPLAELAARGVGPVRGTISASPQEAPERAPRPD